MTAQSKAEELLLSRLTARQRRSYQRYRDFTVKSSTGRRYVIDADALTHNIRQVRWLGLRYGRRYCVIIPRFSPDLWDVGGESYRITCYPHADQLLAQAMLLATDEAAFLKIAR